MTLLNYSPHVPYNKQMNSNNIRSSDDDDDDVKNTQFQSYTSKKCIIITQNSLVEEAFAAVFLLSGEGGLLHAQHVGDRVEVVGL